MIGSIGNLAGIQQLQSGNMDLNAGTRQLSNMGMGPQPSRVVSPEELQGIGSNEAAGLETRQLRHINTTDSFADMLNRAVGSVDQTMKESDQQIQDFIAGKTDNVHDVMISMQRAQLSFQMMVEIRNKAIEAYHEISRMQI